MTDVDIDGIMQEEMTWAVKQKRGCKIDDENAFSMRVTIVGPDGQLARVPMQWHSMDDKYKKMAVLSNVCGRANARAAIVTTDTRYLVVDKFCERFKLIFPPTETFGDDYSRIMADYNYEMGRLPRQLWQEALNVIAYGPRIARMMVTQYSVVDHGYVFEPAKLMDNSGDGETVNVSLVPAWWV